MNASRTLLRAAVVAGLVASFVGPSRAARAGVVFSGSGTNPEASTTASGSAAFTISGNTLTLTLTNTTSPRTAAQGNALTGVSFDLSSGHPVLSLTGIALTPGSRLWTSRSASNTSAALAGSWTNVLGSSPLGEYGVATTGFNGRFNGGSITLGNASPNYGIVAANTFGGAATAFSGSRFPFIQNSLTFTFTGFSGVTESQIGNVKLLFGTDGTGVIGAYADAPAAPAAVPEPSSVLLGLSEAAGLVGFAVWRRRFRRLDAPGRVLVAIR
jgi:hypothetical protein